MHWVWIYEKRMEKCLQRLVTTSVLVDRNKHESGLSMLKTIDESYDTILNWSFLKWTGKINFSKRQCQHLHVQKLYFISGIRKPAIINFFIIAWYMSTCWAGQLIPVLSEAATKHFNSSGIYENQTVIEQRGCFFIWKEWKVRLILMFLFIDYEL